jgi:transposase
VPAELNPNPAGGAPLKLTAERQQRLCDAIRAGVRAETAAVYCGIGARTYYRWMSSGRAAGAAQCYVEFVEAVELALAEWEARDVLLIGEAAKDDWHAAAWRLERRLPKVYGKRERHDIANADDSAFRIRAAAQFDPDKLTVEELEQLIALTEKAAPDDVDP